MEVHFKVTDYILRFFQIALELQENEGLEIESMAINEECQTCNFFIFCPVKDENGKRESWEEHHVILQEYIEKIEEPGVIFQTKHDDIAMLCIK